MYKCGVMFLELWRQKHVQKTMVTIEQVPYPEVILKVARMNAQIMMIVILCSLILRIGVDFIRLVIPHNSEPWEMLEEQCNLWILVRKVI